MSDQHQTQPPVESAAPRTGGLGPRGIPEDADYAIQMLHELEGRMRGPLELRLEPEHYVIPKRPCRSS